MQSKTQQNMTVQWLIIMCWAVAPLLIVYNWLHLSCILFLLLWKQWNLCEKAFLDDCQFIYIPQVIMHLTSSSVKLGKSVVHVLTPITILLVHYSPLDFMGLPLCLTESNTSHHIFTVSSFNTEQPETTFRKLLVSQGSTVHTGAELAIFGK